MAAAVPSAVVATVRQAAVFAERSDLVAYEVRGSDALDLLGRLSTQDLAPLRDGASVTTLFLSPEGRVRHRTALVPAGEVWRALDEPAGPDVEPLSEWLEHYTFAEDVVAEPLTDHATLAIVGSEARALARELVTLDDTPGAVRLDAEGRLCVAGSFGALPAVLVSGPAPVVGALAGSLRDRPGLVEADAAGWLQLRVEAGVPAGGAELVGGEFPAEAGLLDDVSFTKGCYTGQEVVARQDTYGKVARRLVGLVFGDPPAPGAALGDGPRAGRVTSVAPEPPGEPAGHLALGYVRTKEAEPGSRVSTVDGASATVIALPTPRLR